jgi:hypothetical protein
MDDEPYEPRHHARHADGPSHPQADTLRCRPAAIAARGAPQVGPLSRFTLAAVRFEDLLQRVEVRGDRGLYSRSRQRRDEPQRA